MSGRRTSSVPRLPNAKTAEEARAVLRALPDGAGPRAPVEIRIGRRGRKKVSIALPREAVELLREMLGHMASGDAVSIVPIHAELTTEEAADLLNVSRPYVVRLLDDQKIPHHKVGTHRRILTSDLLVYKAKDDACRKKILAELTAEAEKLGLGY